MRFEVHHYVHFDNAAPPFEAIIDALNHIGENISAGREDLTAVIDRLPKEVVKELKEVIEAAAVKAVMDNGSTE